MRCRSVCAGVLLLTASLVHATNYVVPTTTLAALKANNTSAANSFLNQTNGNAGAGSVSKVNVHSLLYAGSSTKVYAHLMLWFGGSNHMNVGYNSNDARQIHRQITDMISRGIDGVIVDWYGPNNSIDQATQLVMAEAESHPGFAFAIMVDQGAIKWNSCSGCSPQQALIKQLQYVEQTYFPSRAYMTEQGHPVVTNFDIDLAYSIDWKAVNAALSTNPHFLFQNNNGFTHVLSGGSYSWVMPTTTDYGMAYLKGFYAAGMPLTSEQTVGAGYKGFNDTLSGWGSNRIMKQQCGQTWLHTFSQVNSLYNSGKQLASLQLVTWNDYEEGTEIESGINNCFSVSATTSGNSLQWKTTGDLSTVDRFSIYISLDGQNLMSLGDAKAGLTSLNLCSYPIPNGKYTFYVKAVGKPSITNQVSGPATLTVGCGNTGGSSTLSLGATPSALNIAAGGSGKVTVRAVAEPGTLNQAITLACPSVPQTLDCAFAPDSIAPGGSMTSVLTISATSVRARMQQDRRTIVLASSVFSMSMVGLVAAGNWNRKRLRALLGSCVLALLIAGGTSCGGGSMKDTPGSYPVTISGSSASIQLSTTVTVVMQ